MNGEKKTEELEMRLARAASGASAFLESITTESMPVVKISRMPDTENVSSANYGILVEEDRKHDGLRINYGLLADVDCSVDADDDHDLEFILPFVFLGIIRIRYGGAIERFFNAQKDGIGKIEADLTVRSYSKLLAATYIARNAEEDGEEALEGGENDCMETTLKNYVSYDLAVVDSFFAGFAKRFDIKNEMKRMSKAAERSAGRSTSSYISYCYDRLAGEALRSGFANGDFGSGIAPDERLVRAAQSYHSFISSMLAFYIFMSNKGKTGDKIKEFCGSLAT